MKMLKIIWQDLKNVYKENDISINVIFVILLKCLLSFINYIAPIITVIIIGFIGILFVYYLYNIIWKYLKSVCKRAKES